jgi:hypothetical protein
VWEKGRRKGEEDGTRGKLRLLKEGLKRKRRSLGGKKHLRMESLVFKKS